MNFRNILLFKRGRELIWSWGGSSAGESNAGDSQQRAVVITSDPAELEALGEVLSGLDLEVLELSPQEGTLERLQQAKPALVVAELSDATLELYPHYQSLAEGSAENPVSFIFITRAGQTPVQLIGHQSFARDYIQRPISPPELKSRVQSVLRSTTGFSEPENYAPPAGEAHPMPEEPAAQTEGPTQSEGESPVWERVLEPVKATPEAPHEPERPTPHSPSRIESLDELLEEINWLLPEDWERLGHSPVTVSPQQEPAESARPAENLQAEIQTPEEDLSGRTAEAFAQEFIEEQAVGRPKPEVATRKAEKELSFAEILAIDERLTFSTRPDLMEEEDAWRGSSLTCSELYQRAQRVVLEVLGAAAQGQKPEITQLGRLVDEMIPAVETSPALLLASTDREQKFSVCAHSVNVAVLALRIAHTLQRSPESKREVAFAALLHEIGMVRLPVLQADGSPDIGGAEIQDPRIRAVYSAEILAQWGPAFKRVAETVGRVFERENGKGYPAGLMGQEFQEEARIIAIADLFEAAIHVRPHRGAITGYQALFELTTDRTSAFSDRILKSLIKSFSLYPYNELVLLNSGEVGRVVDIHRDSLSRPVVQLLSNAQGERIAEPKILDLTQYPTLYVVRSIGTRE